jgi:DNA (cytosine-5)-methyltransferase 1
MTSRDFDFIDLFAGIGGTRRAFELAGGGCVFASEKDEAACKVYEKNFGMEPNRDITEVDPSDVPDHDVLVAGFPCQPFSLAGNRHGFNEPDKGTMFYCIRNIVREKKPKAFFLENVKGLLSIEGGDTIKTMLHLLRDQCEYYVPEPEVINALDFGLPQDRERVFIVGFSKETGIEDFEYPAPMISAEKRKKLHLGTVLEDWDEMPKLRDKIPKKYYLSEGYLKCLENHKETQKKKGYGFGYCIKDPEKDPASTLMVGGMGRERNLIQDPNIDMNSKDTGKKTPINEGLIRTLTPREFARLQGFSDDFDFSMVSDINAYRLFGNSVAIPAVKATADCIIERLSQAGLL